MAYQPPPVAVVVQGSGDVMVGGVPAARAGDLLSDGSALGAPAVGTTTSNNVFINGRPAVVANGDGGGGGGSVIFGRGVYVNGKPLVGLGDAVAK